MNAATKRHDLAGPAGVIDVALDRPQSPVRGIAVIAHPHPLYGGTRDNKVVQTLARGLLARGYVCWRPNFRGIGDSAGSHDEGAGETDDLLIVAAAAREQAAQEGLTDLPLLLAGFSFGCFVQSRVAQRLAQAGAPAARLILVAPAVSRFALESVPADTLVIHGETDDLVPLRSVFDWARPQTLPILVVPGADHFFHHKLPVLKQIVMTAIGAADGPSAR